jgi:hypothetical protein
MQGKYLSNKKAYFEVIKLSQTGGVITDDYDFDTLIKDTFDSFFSTSDKGRDLAIMFEDNVKALKSIDNLKQHSSSKKSSSYDKDRYANVPPQFCDDNKNKMYWKNTISSKTYLDSKKMVFENILLSRLPFTDSNGNKEKDGSIKEWNSFNWAIFKNIDKESDKFGKFVFGITQLDRSSLAELGAKHVFIAWPHDFYVGGERKQNNST